MDKKEFALFAAAIKTCYSREKNILPNEQAMEMWYRALKDIPYTIAEMALQKWIATEPWSPTIADIRKKITSIHWEAHEVVRTLRALDEPPKDKLKKYEWIYEVTQGFRYEKAIEPTISQMIAGGYQLQIGGGKR